MFTRPVSRPRFWRLLVGLALAASPACKRSSPKANLLPEAPTPDLGSVTMVDFTPPAAQPEGVKIDVRTQEARIRGLLGDAKLFAHSGGDAGARVSARVRLEVGLEDVVVGTKGAARAVLHLRIDTRPSEVADQRWNEDVQAGSEMQYTANVKVDRQRLFNDLVNRTVNDVIKDYVNRQKLWTGDTAIVHAGLNSDAGETRVEAIRAVGARKLIQEVPRLLSLLDDEDESVRDAALGALVTLHERKAVSVLANQRSMRDKREMRKILDAMALLGGNEATDYLAFVADGHDDPEIRQMANDARQRLLRRQDAGHP